MTKMTTIQKCNEIMQGMAFLGIPTEAFSEMKKEYAGIDGVYAYIQDCLIAHEVNEVFHGRNENDMTVLTITIHPSVKVAPALNTAPQPAKQSEKLRNKQKKSSRNIEPIL